MFIEGMHKSVVFIGVDESSKNIRPSTPRPLIEIDLALERLPT